MVEKITKALLIFSNETMHKVNVLSTNLPVVTLKNTTDNSAGYLDKNTENRQDNMTVFFRVLP